MENPKRPHHKQVCLHSQVTRASETQHDGAHARKVTSHNAVHSDTDNICCPYLNGGGEYTNGNIHSPQKKYIRKPSA